MSPPTPDPQSKDEERPLSQNRRILRGAAILAFGNVASRVLGLVREVVKANLFGASGLLSAFTVASLVPKTLYDLIVGGELLTSSLVPVFSDYAADPKKRADLWEAFSAFLSLAIVILLVLIGVVEFFAPQVARLAGANNFEDPALFAVTVDLLRLATPAVLFMSVASVLTALLYALERFTLPAFSVAIYNASIILVAVLRPDEISSLVWGILLGALLQVILQLPALRDATFRFRIVWRHPAVRRIILLFLPVAGGLVINQIGAWVGYRLAITTGDEGLTYMYYGTTLYQLPQGLIVMGLSLAILPLLSQQASGELAVFKQTLGQGIRFVLTFMLPTVAVLFALSLPVVDLLFEHGKFTPQDSLITARVVRYFMPGLVFAGVDLMLVFASYARQDTLRPAIVGALSIGVYIGVAYGLLPLLGLFGLMLADGAKHVVHTLMMLWVMERQIGGLRGLGIGRVLWKALVAGGASGLSAYGAWRALPALGDGLLGEATAVLLPVAVAGGVYIACVFLLDIPEAKSLRQLLRKG